MADFIKGEDLIVYVWTGAAYLPIGCLTSNSINIAKTIVEQSTKCDPGLVIRASGTKSYEIPFEAVYIDTTSATGDATKVSHDALLPLFDTDEDIDTFYMLIMGQVAHKVSLSPDVNIILDTIQSGSSFGVASLVPGTNASSTAVCQEPCEVITLSSKKMTQLFEKHNELGYKVMLRLALHYKKILDNRTNMIMKTLDTNPELRHKIDDIESLTPIF